MNTDISLVKNWRDSGFDRALSLRPVPSRYLSRAQEPKLR